MGNAGRALPGLSDQAPKSLPSMAPRPQGVGTVASLSLEGTVCRAAHGAEWREGVMVKRMGWKVERDGDSLLLAVSGRYGAGVVKMTRKDALRLARILLDYGLKEKAKA